MAQSQENTQRKPATKFSQLQKKLFRNKGGKAGGRNASVHQVQRGHQQRHA